MGNDELLVRVVTGRCNRKKLRKCYKDSTGIPVEERAELDITINSGRKKEDA